MLAIFGLLVATNFIQLGIALHDRRVIIAHMEDLAISNARKTLSLAYGARAIVALSRRVDDGSVRTEMIHLSSELSRSSVDGIGHDCSMCPVSSIAIGKCG